MLSQYGAPRFTVDARGRRVGTVQVGTILYIQDRMSPFGFSGSPVRRDPWIVESWHNRAYHPAVPGRPHTVYMRGGHLATVRSLRSGRRAKVADWMLLLCVDAGLERCA